MCSLEQVASSSATNNNKRKAKIENLMIADINFCNVRFWFWFLRQSRRTGEGSEGNLCSSSSYNCLLLAFKILSPLTTLNWLSLCMFPMSKGHRCQKLNKPTL